MLYCTRSMLRKRKRLEEREKQKKSHNYCILGTSLAMDLDCNWFQHFIGYTSSRIDASCFILTQWNFFVVLGFFSRSRRGNLLRRRFYKVLCFIVQGLPIYIWVNLCKILFTWYSGAFPPRKHFPSRDEVFVYCSSRGLLRRRSIFETAKHESHLN